MPKVSIISPCYNLDRYVRAAMESVRTQTYTDWEMIVVDDGSKDASARVIAETAKSDDRFRWISQSNRGVCAARNAGFAASSRESDFLLFLDADDVLKPNMLEILVAYLEAHPEVGMVFCGHDYIDENGSPIALRQDQGNWTERWVPTRYGVRRLRAEEANTPFSSILGGACIAPSMSLIRRSVYEGTAGWDETFGHVYEDAHLFLHIALRSKIHLLSQVLVRYRQHLSQSTKSSERVRTQEQKLHAKWTKVEGLTSEQATAVENARRFVYGRLAPYRGVLAGNKHVRENRCLTAFRFYGGAIRLYFRSIFFPRSFNSR